MIDEVFEAAKKKVVSQTKKKKKEEILDKVSERAAIKRIGNELGIRPVVVTNSLKNYDNDERKTLEEHLVKRYEEKNNTSVEKKAEEIRRKIASNIAGSFYGDGKVRLPSPTVSPNLVFTSPYGGKSVTIQKNDGTVIGNISSDAYWALMDGRLEFYQHKTTDERKTLENYIQQPDILLGSQYKAETKKQSNPQYYEKMEYYAGIINGAHNNRDTVTGLKKEYKEKYDELMAEYTKKAMENPWNPEYAKYTLYEEGKINPEIDKVIKEKYPEVWESQYSGDKDYVNLYGVPMLGSATVVKSPEEVERMFAAGDKLHDDQVRNVFNGINDGNQNIYKYLSPKEIQIGNMLYGLSSKNEEYKNAYIDYSNYLLTLAASRAEEEIKDLSYTGNNIADSFLAFANRNLYAMDASLTQYTDNIKKLGKNEIRPLWAPIYGDYIGSNGAGQIRDLGVLSYEAAQEKTAEISADIKKKYGGFAGACFDLTNAFGDIGVQIAISKGTMGMGGSATMAKGLSMSNMFFQSSASTMISMEKRGATPEQQLIGGTMMGLVTVASENISYGNLLNPKNVKTSMGHLFNGLKAGVSEGFEEVVEGASELIVDAVIMGENSESNIRKRQYIAQGMTAEEASKKVLLENAEGLAYSFGISAVAGGMSGSFTSIGQRSAFLSDTGNYVLGNPSDVERIVSIGLELDNDLAKTVNEILENGGKITTKQAGKLVESVVQTSIEKDASLPGVVKVIGAIEGRSPEYYNSQEAIDTARAVQRMANGTSTKADYALIERSEGARTVVLSAEGTKAWDSLRAEADKRVRNAEYGMRSESLETSGVKYKGDEHAVVKDGDVFTKDGRKVTISAKADTVNGIVVNGESKRFQKNDSKGYSVAEKLATSFKKPVKFVKGLYDAEGNMLDGAETDSGIFINTEAKNPIKWAATHEFSHTMKKRAGEAWSAYQKFVINKLKKDGTYYKVFDTKAKAYGTRDAAYINEEIACDYIGETFDSVDELADLIRKDRGLAVKVRDFYYKALDKLGLLDEKKKAQAMWAKAYREAMKNSDVKYEDGAHQSKSGTRVSDDSGLQNDAKDGIVDMNDEICVIPKQSIVFAGMYDRMNADKEFNSLYKAAKDGNIEAAKELAEKYITNDFLETFTNKYSNVSIIPVIGVAPTTTNVMPEYISKYIAEITGNEYYGGVYKTSKNNFKSGKKSSAERLVENIEFAFKNEVEKNIHGKHFVIFDDCISTGTTVSALREFIEENGGIVDGFASLAKGRDSTDNIAITREQFEQLNELTGGEYSYEISRFTARQAETLIGNPELQNRIFDRARTERVDGDISESGTGVREWGKTGGKSETRRTEEERNPVTSGKKSVAGTRVVDNPSVSDAETSDSSSLTTSLLEENKRLRKELENIHLQLEQTEGKGLDTKAIKKAAEDIKRAYFSKIKTSELHKDLTKLYSDMAGDKLGGDEVGKRIREIAEKVIGSATETIEYSEYGDLLDTIRKTRIAVPEDDKASFADGFSQFKKSNRGKLNLNDDGYPLDALWDDLCADYPQLFSEETRGSEEKLKRLLEVRDEFSPYEKAVFNSDESVQRARYALENDIMESFFKIPEGGDGKYVFYDTRAAQAQKELEQAKEKFEKLLERTVKKLESKIEKTELAYENEINRIETRHEREIDKMGKAVERAEEKVTKMRDKRDREKVSKSIDRVFGFLFNMAENPTDARHIPEKLKKDVQGFVNRFIYETKTVGKKDPKETKVLVSVRLDQIGKAYESILRKAWESDLNESPLLDERLSEAFSELMDEIPEDASGNFKRLEDMTTRELATISDMLTGIHHAITQSNKLFSENIKATKSEASANVDREMDDTRSKRKGNGERWVYSGERGIYQAYNWLKKFVTADMLQPWDAFHRIGGTMENLFGEARKAFNKHIENLQKTKAVINKAVGKLKIREMTGNKQKDYTFELLGGEKIKLFKGQILSLYALYKRPQGRMHIESGGIVTTRLVWGTDGHKTGGAINLAYQDFEKIFKEISKEEIQMVDEIVKFMSKECAAWGNEASMKLLGFEKYGEGWYFPIKVWDGTKSKEGKKKGDRKLTGQTFTKELVKDAGNAIVIEDFFDTVLDHVVGMSLYNTVALPILDMERVLNHTADNSTVRQARAAIEKTYGSNVVDYIYTWMSDVNGNKQAIQKDGLTDFFLRNATKINIAFKLSVLLKQGTSITRACQVINPIHITAAINGIIHPKKTIAEMQEHVPIAYYKSLGFRNPYTSRDIKTAILDMETVSDKAAFGGYGVVDDFTWGIIYTAVKNEVESDIKKNNLDIEIGSAEYWEKVRERFDYVIDRTQVVDSVFHRSQIMRSNNPITKIQTLYMSEPIKSLNMYRTELQDGIRNKTKLKSIGKSFAVYVAGGALLAAVGALAKVLKDDEDDYYDKDTGKRLGFGERYFGHTKDSALDELNPMNMVPYLSTIVDIAKGWSQKDIIWQNVEKGIKQMQNVYEGNGKTWYRNMYDVATAVSAVFGIPYGNALKEVEGLARTFMHQLGDEYADYLITKSKWDVNNPSNESKFMKYYERAIANGHADDANLILNDYLSSVYKEKDFKNEHSEAVLGEVTKLYGKTENDSKLVFGIPDDKFSFDGETVVIPENDYDEYVEGYYDILWKTAYEFVNSDEYAGLSNEDKVRSFGEIKTYAAEAQRMESVDGYELTGWKGEVYAGETDFIDSVMERKENREYQAERDVYKDSFSYDASKYTAEELTVIEQVESDAASYYTAIEMGREYNESDLRHMQVYDDYISSEMEIEEYAGVRAYAKKTAAMADGSKNMTKDELKTYLDSTDYSPAMKAALFEAIGNKNWKNPYTGGKIGDGVKFPDID